MCVCVCVYYNPVAQQHTEAQSLQTNEGLTFNCLPTEVHFLFLYCIDGVVIAALIHCDLFEIYCVPPNLGIART